MRLEKKIQDWIVDLARGHKLHDALRFAQDPVSQEMRRAIEERANISNESHRSVNQACRIVDALIEPNLYSANRRLSDQPDSPLFPDLVLEDVKSKALVLIELKRSVKAAREFGTELLAYANEIKRKHPSTEIFLVLVSTAFAPLTRHAILMLARSNVPFLPLEFREADEAKPTLLVRGDLLPTRLSDVFPQRALRVETKTFHLPHEWRRFPHESAWRNRIQHAVSSLTREAEKSGFSGFTLAWHDPYDVPHVGRVRVYVSMAVRDEQRPPLQIGFGWLPGGPEDGGEEINYPISEEPLTSDVQVRLLQNLSIAADVPWDSSEVEGTWKDLHDRLEDQRSDILHFEAFGGIGDHIQDWREQKRYAMRDVIRDITTLHTWHPLTWMPALSSVMQANEDIEDVDAEAYSAYRLGQDLSHIGSVELSSAACSSRCFARAAALAQFATAWYEHFAELELPRGVFAPTLSGIRCDVKKLECAIALAFGKMEEQSLLAGLCFALGYYREMGAGNFVFLIERRSQLRNRSINLPDELNLLLNEIEERNAV